LAVLAKAGVHEIYSAPVLYPVVRRGCNPGWQQALRRERGVERVSVIATATNTVVGSAISVGLNPEGVAVTPEGSKVYVANSSNGTVSVNLDGSGKRTFDQSAPLAAWRRFGMTTQQVAEVYGVAVTEIERIIRNVV
jgi:hypothetical protein